MTQPRKKILICGATGFIGRNLVNHFEKRKDCEVFALHHRTPVSDSLLHTRAHLLRADLTNPADVEQVIEGMDVVIQAAATTSGAKDIVTKPYYHVTDNAVMNSWIFRWAHENKVKQVIFFSCTTMYPEKHEPVKEEDFTGEIVPKYFGVGWTKVYLEKMCEFYASLNQTQFAAIRHSNIYGPFDKFDLERSHVFGATVAKAMKAQVGGKITVWGDGSDERDLLYVQDLVDFVELLVDRQQNPYELLNLSSGHSVSVRELISKIVKAADKSLSVEYDTSKPTIGYKLKVDSSRARKSYGWSPKVSLDEGIAKTLEWYRANLFEAAPQKS